MKQKGYVYEDKRENCWYARVTVTDNRGKRRNVKKRAASEREALNKPKARPRQLEEEESKGVDFAKLTFSHLADYYERHYLKPAEYVEGRKISGLRDLKRPKGFLPHFRAYFGKKKLREITYGDIYSYRTLRLQGRVCVKFSGRDGAGSRARESASRGGGLSGAEGARGLLYNVGEEVCAGAAALGQVGAAAASAFEGAAGFAEEGVHVAGRVGVAREDEARARLFARAEQRHRARVRGDGGGEPAEVFSLAAFEDARDQSQAARDCAVNSGDPTRTL